MKLSTKISTQQYTTDGFSFVIFKLGKIISYVGKELSLRRK